MDICMKYIDSKLEKKNDDVEEEIEEEQFTWVKKFSAHSDAGKRCASCLDEITGEEHKKKKAKLSKINRRCQNCDSAICNKHTYFGCGNCADNFVMKPQEETEPLNQNIV